MPMEYELSKHKFGLLEECLAASRISSISAISKFLLQLSFDSNNKG